MVCSQLDTADSRIVNVSINWTVLWLSEGIVCNKLYGICALRIAID